ncbi:MAG: TIGR03000 domain-containing protein [Pirellulales bacterium]|nr:TIGR03000 domain-containing protein [Pirellulales bacterium]
MVRNLKFVLAAVVGIAVAACDVNRADAFWGRHGSWGSSGGSWGSSGGSWGSWGSSGGSWGHHRWHSSGGSWGSSGGSWGSSGGSSGGYAVYYGSSGGSSGGSWGSSGGSSGGTVIYDGPAHAAPAAPAAPTPAPGTTAPVPGAAPSGDTPPAPMPGSVYRRLGGDHLAMISVNVPGDAKVFVNGAATTSTGAERQFVSRGLSTGNRYTYEVRAEMQRNGETVTETKSITLGMGEQAHLAFNFNTAAPVAKGEKAKTKLTLRVPADAKVFLSGRETSSTGEVREFTTSKLAPGAEWNDYTVRVVANLDGREVTKEETLTLIGGEDRELNMDFGSTEIAQTAAVTR